MASFSGQGMAVPGIVAARRARSRGAGRSLGHWAAILLVALPIKAAPAATFATMGGELEIRAGSKSPLSTPAVVGSVSLIDTDFASGFHVATASLISSVSGGNRFSFSATATSTTNMTAPVDQFNATATILFEQQFTTLVPQWLELSARVTSPPADLGVDAVLTVTRAGQGAPAFELGHTGSGPVTVSGRFPAGVYTVMGSIDTRAATIGTHSGVIDGSILIAELGDFNGNGTVDGGDLPTWRAGFGSLTGTFASGNLDGDGDTDGADFLLWQKQLGTSTLVESAAASIPEPASGVLGVGGLVVAARYCRTRRSAARRDSASPAR